MDVVITNRINPTFTQIGPLCQNSTAPVLPASSTNSISGTWSTATINTATAGTTTYTFTPDAGQCAAVATMDIVVSTSVVPTFTQIGPLCQNSTAPALPLTSSNSIAGTWNPATIGTITAGTTTYTFTPDAGQCATTATMDVVITNQINPTFTQIGPLCQNSTAPALPLSSTNSITGHGARLQSIPQLPGLRPIHSPLMRTVHYDGNDGSCYYQPDHTNIYADRAVVPKQYCAHIAIKFHQCHTDYRNMEPRNNRNHYSWNNNLYLYPGCRSVCRCGNNGDCSNFFNHTNIYADRPLCQNSTAPALPSSSANATPITGTWNPATIGTATAGTTTYTFTPDAGQCATTATMEVVITNQITPTFTQIGPLCQNSTAPPLPLSSTNATPITGTWNPTTIGTATVGTTTYTFTPDAGQCATPATMDIVVTTSITPTFTQIGPLCQNSTAPTLPLSSTNATPITGTWNPATIGTATVETTTYTFTPDAGQCAAVVTMDIVVSASVVPTYTAIGPLCQNSTAPVLPASSINGISGTWNPATIGTTTAGTTTYTFTPDAGQCATTATMDVVITSQITPTFTQIGPLCQNSTAPALPSSSTNATPITGTWSPASVSTATVGTTTYTFTPDAGQCAAVTTMEIVVTNSVVPTFTPVGPLCQNSTAPALPASSTGNITGTWSPATINTTTAGTTTYTFTPDAGQCAAAATMDIVVTSSITPTFTQIGPLCQNSTAPVLPASSTNATPITGTWSPASVSTATVGTVTYTFTPDAGQCAAVATMEIVVTNSVVPTFTQIGPLCQNSTAPTLPLRSTNATPITGTWNPVAIGTTTAGTTTYTFTPDAAQCATTATMDIVVTTSITPTFTAIGPLCQNSTAPALPSSSTNATPITGTWNPATIGTATAGTTTYTFTPDAGQCAAVATMEIVVSTSVTPTFAQIGPLCQNSTAPVLPASSTNSISGTWSPATVSTVTVGTTTYTFTPDAGQCTTMATMEVVITNQITPIFTQIGPLCQNSTAPALQSSSTNATPITGTWNPATIGTTTVGTTTYTFTPDAGQCAAPATMDIVVTTSITPTFTAIGPLCQSSTAPALPSSSTNATPITGTWNPATIGTATAGTTTYTFTP